MLKKGIVRFIKAHGIAILAVAALALILRLVLHFNYILSFVVLLVLYFVIGFAIDVISEKIRLKKAKNSIAGNKQSKKSVEPGPSAERPDPSSSSSNLLFDMPSESSDDASPTGSSAKKNGTLKKLSTNMRSIIAASPEGGNGTGSQDKASKRDPAFDRSSVSSNEDFVRGTGFTFNGFARRNHAKKENAADNTIVEKNVETENREDPETTPAADAADVPETTAEIVHEEPAVNVEPEKPSENVSDNTEKAVGDAEKVIDEEVKAVNDAVEEAQFTPPDISADTVFSEEIADAVDKIVNETPKNIVRRNRYKIFGKVEETVQDVDNDTAAAVDTASSAAADIHDELKQDEIDNSGSVRSHISKVIDEGNTLFSVMDENDEPEPDEDDAQDSDMVKADYEKVSNLFVGRKPEHHKKPALEEYRRRTENSGGTGRKLTREILEGDGSGKNSESESLSLFDAVSETAVSEIAGSKTEAKKTEEKKEEKKPEKLPEIKRVYEIPPVDLLSGARGTDNVGVINSEDDPKAQKLIATLESFGVGAKITGVMRGPAVTRYELQPNPGVKVSRIVSLSDDIALNLASTGVRIEAPIPGKEAVGIEVPNSQIEIVSLRQVVESEEFRNSQSSLSVALGRDIAGKNIVADIAKMPHLLIAGATGSGKSVCINTIVASILFKAGPEDVRMIMIDPKIVELGVYNGIPHLLVPVVTNPKKAAGALSWAVAEMENRYTLFSQKNVRDIKAFNVLAQRDKTITKLPQILIIIDELADLMMVAAKEIEDSIIRLSQKARAAGLHIIIATQRPSVDVITGLIKANIPSRIAFAVTSQIDSRTILDGGGAEKLLGRGDMLFHPIGMAKPLRVQGAFVSDSEIEALADNVRNSYGTALYSEEIQSTIDQKDKPQGAGNTGASEGGEDDQDNDNEMIDAAARLALEYKQLSTSFLQRKLRLGYSRASRIVDTLEAEGLISEADGSKPRQLLMTKEEWEAHIAGTRGEQ